MTTARHIWSILLPRQRRAGVALFALVLVGTALEMFSVGLVVPALAFMTRGNSAPSPRLAAWLEWLGNPSSNKLILLVLLLLLGVYAVKSAFLLFVAYWQSRFVTATQASTSRRLFAIYLAQPWTFHLQRHSAELMRTINESHEFSHICSVFLMTVSEALVLSGLVGLLLWFEPTGAIVVAGMLGAAAWLFNALARPRSRRWANAQRHHAKMIIKHVQQGLGGAKDVKIRGCEQEFLDQFRHHSDGQARMAALQSLVHQVPRLWFELLAVAALLLLTAVMVWQGTPSERLLPMLGLFATVAFRMLPSVNHMTSAIHRLRTAESMLIDLAKELGLARETASIRPTMPLAFRDAIVLDNVRFRYPGSRENVLDSVSIRIPHGASVGFIGGSGADRTSVV
jgi:ABC-type multidrug transport system fused ATPase/permease subunit